MVAQFEELRDATFDNGEWVIVDNRHFYNCKFVQCHLVYAGGLFGFYNCEVALKWFCLSREQPSVAKFSLMRSTRT
jgi:hypothetical protein